MIYSELVNNARDCCVLLKDELRDDETVADCMRRIIREAHELRRLGASKPEPAPQNQDGPALWPLVIMDLLQDEDPIRVLVAKDAQKRHEFGIKKYGVPLVAHNGRNHLLDAYQEQLDKVVYLRAHYEQTNDDDDIARAMYWFALREAIELRRMMVPS